MILEASDVAADVGVMKSDVSLAVISTGVVSVRLVSSLLP